MSNLSLFLLPILYNDLKVLHKLNNHLHLLLRIIRPGLPSIEILGLGDPLDWVLKRRLALPLVALVIQVVNSHQDHAQF